MLRRIIIIIALSFASSAQATELRDLPAPVAPACLSVPAPTGFSPHLTFWFEDCVEMTLLRLIQGFTQGELAAFHPDPDLLAFFEANQLNTVSTPASFYESAPGLALRARWAQFVAYRPDLVYRTPLHEEAQTFEIKATWENISALFWQFFPGLRPRLEEATTDDGQVQAICRYFRSDFTCDTAVQTTTDGMDTVHNKVITIFYGTAPYLRWTLSETVRMGVRVRGDTYLEDLR